MTTHRKSVRHCARSLRYGRLLALPFNEYNSRSIRGGSRQRPMRHRRERRGPRNGSSVLRPFSDRLAPGIRIGVGQCRIYLFRIDSVLFHHPSFGFFFMDLNFLRVRLVIKYLVLIFSIVRLLYTYASTSSVRFEPMRSRKRGRREEHLSEVLIGPSNPTAKMFQAKVS